MREGAMAHIDDLARQLQHAIERRERAAKAWAANFKVGEESVEYWAANAAMLALERQLAAAKGEQYAETLDFPVQWEIGVPLPYLMVNDRRALLAFLVHQPDPNWDGSSAKYIQGPKSTHVEPLALVEFEHCASAKLGGPNDEVFHGHPLHGKGLEANRAQRVVNSRWLAELEAINRVHDLYRPEFWRNQNHYVFWFHDKTFECLARSYRVEVFRETWAEMFARMVQRLTT
jgi:hypothetical protein